VRQMGRLPYDITHYQPVLFAADDFTHLVQELRAFFDAFDDEAYVRHYAPRARDQLTG
jgi:phenylalanine-4-hydroxylase